MARTRIYFVSDVHASERCWLKFLAAPKFYGADTLIVGIIDREFPRHDVAGGAPGAAVSEGALRGG